MEARLREHFKKSKNSRQFQEFSELNGMFNFRIHHKASVICDHTTSSANIVNNCNLCSYYTACIDIVALI